MGIKIVAKNKKAFHEYHIDATYEAGMVLSGPEVKSLRAGRGNLADSYAAEVAGELFIFNAYIPEYAPASRLNHETRRMRKLLVHRRERDRLLGAIRRDGVTLVPLSIYFNDRGIAKVELGIARGKRKYDKRESEKQRDWQRQKQRLLRDRG